MSLDPNENMKRFTNGTAHRLNAGRLPADELQKIVALYAPGAFIDDDGVAKTELGTHLEEALAWAINNKAGSTASSVASPARADAGLSAEQKISNGTGDAPPKNEQWRARVMREPTPAECAKFYNISVEEFAKNYPGEKRIQAVGEVQSAWLKAAKNG